MKDRRIARQLLHWYTFICFLLAKLVGLSRDNPEEPSIVTAYRGVIVLGV